MDYYELQNLKADTDMRSSISGAGSIDVDLTGDGSEWINMTFKGLTEELSRTLISEKCSCRAIWVHSALCRQYVSKEENGKGCRSGVLSKWEEEADMDEVPEALMQQVSPSAGRAAQRPHQQETSRMPEGRAALRGRRSF